MTVKLTATWDIKSCDGCGDMNTTDEDFPSGWCVLVSNDDDTLNHRAYCSECDPRVTSEADRERS